MERPNYAAIKMPNSFKGYVANKKQYKNPQGHNFNDRVGKKFYDFG